MQFKLYSTIAIVLCICFVQICKSLDDQTKRKCFELKGILDLNSYLNGSRAIKDINPEFVEDLQVIFEKFNHNLYVMKDILLTMNVMADVFNATRAKVNITTVKEKILEEKAMIPTVLPLENDICSFIDRISILPSLLLKELPAERVSGIINLHYAMFGSGTDKDLENALGYLYGTESRPMTPFLDSTLEYSQKCTVAVNGTIPNFIQTLINEMKSLNSTKLNPKVLTDIQIIVDKFPYSVDIANLVKFMMGLLIQLNREKSRIGICQLQNKSPWHDTYDGMEIEICRIIDLETILSTRMSKENSVDMLNLMRANYGIVEGDWKKALEYAYTPEYFNAEWCNQNAVTN